MNSCSADVNNRSNGVTGPSTGEMYLSLAVVCLRGVPPRGRAGATCHTVERAHQKGRRDRPERRPDRREPRPDLPERRPDFPERRRGLLNPLLDRANGPP